jgi:hypothetical protein
LPERVLGECQFEDDLPHGGSWSRAVGEDEFRCREHDLTVAEHYGGAGWVERIVGDSIRRPLQYPVTFGDLREVVVVALARCALFLAYW